MEVQHKVREGGKTMRNKGVRESSSGMNIPDYAIDRIARCMLPMIQKYYESEDGQQELLTAEAQTEAE